MDDLIDTTEMYLKVVLELEEEGIVPLRARVAERLDHAPPTVSGTVARMQRDGLIGIAPDDRRLELTGEGRRRALSVLRKHRLAERLLAEKIGLDWALVHEEACRWEHVMSDAAEHKIAKLLGEPGPSPYGNPIPGPDAAEWPPSGSTAAENLTRFAVAHDASAEARILWFAESLQADTSTMAQLRRSKVLPGAIVHVELHGSSVLARVRGGHDVLELPHKTAARIFVAPA